MITPSRFTAARLMCLLLGSLCVLTGLSTVVCAGADTAGADTIAKTEVSVADLESLVHQIADPQQRDELLKTLRSLIVVAKQGRTGEPLDVKPDLFTEHSQGVFFAVGELTQRLAMSGRRVIRGLDSIPLRLGELTTRLRDPTALWSVMVTTLALVILALLGLSLQLVTRHVENRLRSRILVNAPFLLQRKIGVALLSVGLAVAPYVALLAMSGVVLSLLPIGAVLAGMTALVIFTILLYRFLRAVARVLLDPEALNARLLPLDDSTAQQAWRWVSRLITLTALYFMITRALLTIGANEEFYHVVRGVIILVIATVVSVMLSRLGQRQHTGAMASEGDQRRFQLNPWATLRTIWPIIAIVYIWCAALLAILSGDHELASLMTVSLQMALLIGTGVALIWGVDLLFHHTARQNERVARYIPGLETRTQQYLNVLRWSGRVLIAIGVLLSILQVWGVGIAWLMSSALGVGLLSRLIALAVTAGLVVLVMDLSTFIGQKLVEPTPAGVEPSKKRKTLVPLVATVIKYGALGVGGLNVLHLVGVNITPILAGVGILSLAVGFGAQTLVKDIINGLFILAEDSIAVGDVVTIRGTGGLVEAVNVRTIRLRDLQGSVHLIPNSQVDMITNMTVGYSYYLLDVAVAYGEDSDAVVAALQEIDAEMRADPDFAADMLEPIEILGLDRFTDSAVVLRARLKTKPIKQWSIGREFNRRMKKLFEARGIEIPFPQRTISWSEPKPGGGVPLQLHIDNLEALGAVMGQREQGDGSRHQDKAETR